VVLAVVFATSFAASPLRAEDGSEGAAADPGAAADSGAAAGADALEGDAAYSREGAWLGVGGAFADENFDRKGSYDDAGAIAFRAGYRGYPYFGFELLGEVLTKFDDGGSDPAGDVDGFAVTANGKFFLPLGRVEPWVMAGLGFLDIDRDNNQRRDDIAFRFAGGLDAYVTPRFALYLEAAYMQPTGDVKDWSYATYGAGLLFRF